MNHSEPFGPPVAQASDYVGIAMLAAMVCIGGPLNVLALLRSLGIDVKNAFSRCRKTSVVTSERRRSRRTRLTLNRHLTIANLLVIWVYVLSEVCWRLTYQWLGGGILCRLVRFVHAFCFYATSNLVSTIALDRLYIAVRIDRPGGQAARRNAVRWFANCAWTLALMCSLPQLFVWRTFEPFPNWTQCVTIWQMTRYMLAENASAATVSSQQDGTAAANVQKWIEEADYHERLYNGMHLAFVFWLPVFLIIICYTLIVTRFHRDIRKSTQRRMIEAGSTGEAEVMASSNQPSPMVSRSPQPRLWRKADQAGRTEDTDPSTRVNTGAALSKDSVHHRPLFSCCLGRSTSKHRVVVQLQSQASQTAADQSAAVTETQASVIVNAAVIGAREPLLPRNFAANTLMRAKKRTVKKSFWILLAYLVTWSPYNIMSLWRYFNPAFEHFILEILIDLIVLNAVVNPLIYGI